MLKSFQVIKDPLDYRIINLLNKKRLSDETLQKVLNIPIDKVREHLKKLTQMNFITCDSTIPLNMWRVSDSFIEQCPLFYQMSIIQMQKSPLYQEDLLHLEALNQD